ncbi:MAG TPA: lyase family protein [Acidimicrobiales bacterium]|nr:lyase family protein [Acidimicrobiales bacterium]
MTGAARELVDVAFAYEISTAGILHDGLNLADMAHVLQQLDRGIIPRHEAVKLASVLLAADAVPATEFGYDAALGEPYNSRERVFSAALGDTAGWLHAGRPRREATRVAFRLRLRRDVCRLILGTARLARALARQAHEHRSTLFADHTYLQQAQPSTIGHYFTSFAYPLLRDADRLVGAVRWLDASPGGAGCVNGSRLGTNRTDIATSLGFAHVITNTRDAMWQVDGLVQLASAAASMACTQTSLAEDLEIWASSEFDYVDLAAGYTRASVLMPQKRNPYALSMVRGTAGLLIGHLTGLLAVQKSPSARSDSLIFAYGEVPALVDQARGMTELMAGVVETLTINERRLRNELDGGFTQATDVAEELMVRCGLDYRRAYHIAGRAVRALADDGKSGHQLTSADIDAAACEVLGHTLSIGDDALVAVLDPGSIVATRTAIGGAAPGAIDAMVEDIERRVDELIACAEADLARFASAEAHVRTRTRQLAERPDPAHPDDHR